MTHLSSAAGVGATKLNETGRATLRPSRTAADPLLEPQFEPASRMLAGKSLPKLLNAVSKSADYRADWLPSLQRSLWEAGVIDGGLLPHTSTAGIAARSGADDAARLMDYSEYGPDLFVEATRTTFATAFDIAGKGVAL